MENKFHIKGRIREMSIDEDRLDFTVDNGTGLTARVNLFIDKDCKNRTDAFNLLFLYEGFLTKVTPYKQFGIGFAYDKDYNAEEPWLKQRYFNDDVHHVVQYRFSGIVRNVTVEVTIMGQSSNLMDNIDGFLGSLRIRGIFLNNDTETHGDVLSFEKE